ncbi:hypothetical protein AD998_07570 [bacterium 336/3]|nr:hypothetical protein AD998_07570 [bacterium 336/3]
MSFVEKIVINDWKQFSDIEIEFHPQLTILTGANGSGKTTILNLLGKLVYGNIQDEIAVPSIDKETGGFKYIPRSLKLIDNVRSNIIGYLKYQDGEFSKIKIPDYEVGAVYHIELDNIKRITGAYIPSHRVVFYYQHIPNISTRKIKKSEARLTSSSSIISKLYHDHSSKSTNYFIKETLLNWAISGAGNDFIISDKELKEYFLEFQDILRITLPKSLGFSKIVIKNYEIIFETSTGDFMLDAVSGGISAIIDLVWLIFTSIENKSENVLVIIDEVENHLHATMQREILPSLIEAFPNVQFIVSTHSPLIIGSVKDSNVYALRYNSDKRIFNEKLDIVNKARSANQILDEVLGVSFTMPVWVEKSLEEITNKYANSEITSTIFHQMRNDLKELGLESLVPLTMEKIITKINDQNK